MTNNQDPRRGECNTHKDHVHNQNQRHYPYANHGIDH